ncbi:MAG: DNRLRE domain-containing protein [Aquabacterium sp.]
MSTTSRDRGGPRSWQAALAGAAMVLLPVLAAHAQSLKEFRLSPLADATVFTAQGGGTDYDQVADGRGGSLWTSVTAGGVVRRALVKFDLSPLPPGAVVQSVQLSIHQIRSREDHPVALHRLLGPWTEGPADGGDAGVGALASAGDVTWTHRSWPDQTWAVRGTDYVPTASGSVLVAGAPATYTWPSTAQMVADVQLWLNQPATHHGWLLIGKETGEQNAKRFASRENGSVTSRPVLVVMATVPADLDVPLPAWALLLLGGALLAPLLRRRG